MSMIEELKSITRITIPAVHAGDVKTLGEKGKDRREMNSNASVCGKVDSLDANEVYIALRDRRSHYDLLKIDAPRASLLRKQICNWMRTKGCDGDMACRVDRDLICEFICRGYAADGESVDDPVATDRNDMLKVLEQGAWTYNEESKKHVLSPHAGGGCWIVVKY